MECSDQGSTRAITQQSVSIAVHLTPSSELRHDFRVSGHACTDDREVAVARSRLWMRQQHNEQIWTALRTRQKNPEFNRFMCNGNAYYISIPDPIMPCVSPLHIMLMYCLLSGCSAFSQPSFYICKFSVRVLLKPNLKDFLHYLDSM